MAMGMQRGAVAAGSPFTVVQSIAMGGAAVGTAAPYVGGALATAAVAIAAAL